MAAVLCFRRNVKGFNGFVLGDVSLGQEDWLLIYGVETHFFAAFFLRRCMIGLLIREVGVCLFIVGAIACYSSKREKF